MRHPVINLWKIGCHRCSTKKKNNKITKIKKEYACIVWTLQLQNQIYRLFHPEVCFIVLLDYHAGLIVQSKDSSRIGTS
jgi:hypothetical protein